MRECPHCREEQPGSKNSNCSQCGLPLSKSAVSETDEELGFVVTEASPDQMEFVGGSKDFSRDEEGLEIEAPVTSAAEEVAKDSGHGLSSLSASPTDEQAPVGQSAPHLPSTGKDSADNDRPHGNISGHGPTEPGKRETPSDIKKLSADELKSIEKKMYRDDSYLNDREKEELIKKISSINPSQSSSPDYTADPGKLNAQTGSEAQEAPELPQPAMAEHGKGDAYFYKNFVQLASSQELHVGDELLIRGRTYSLKPKQLVSTITYAAVGLLFTLILIFVGSLLTRSDDNSGKGMLAGLILDGHRQPLTSGATVRLPEAGITVSSNRLGFFDVGAVATGSHRIELIIDGQVVQADYAAVGGGQLTLMTLTLSEPKKSAAAKHTAPPATATVAARSGPEKEKTPKPTATKKKSRPSPPRPGRIKLAANVDGAIFSVDGRTLGAGNLVYNKIKAGRHNYVVEMDGYESAKGTVEIKPGKTANLTVTLKPVEKVVVEEADPKIFLLAEGKTALHDGDYATAELAFGEVIILQPDHHEALLGRAQAHQYRGNKKAAYQDYLAAGNALKNRKAPNQSATAYTNAIRMDGNGLDAYLGRADLYLAKGEAIAATADYEAVRRLDKRNARAYFGLGQARFKLGNYKKAIKHFKDARSIDKKNPLVYQYLMLSYLAVDDSKNVRKSFEKFKGVASDSELDRLMTNKDYTQAIKVAQSH